MEADKKSPEDSRYTILGVRFDLIDYETELSVVDGWIRRGERHYATFSNPRDVEECRRDPEFRRTLSGSGLTLPDGVGIILAANILGFPNRGRVTGPTSMLRLCNGGRERGFRHFFYGGAEGVAEELAKKLTERFPGLDVAGTHCPPFRPLTDEEDEAVVETINRSGANCVWVGLGAPRQEKWMLAHRDRLEASALFGVGAAFDFHSDNVKWAPGIVRKLGVEWAFRLFVEPRRLWRRNLDSFIFLSRVLGQRARALFRR